MKSQSLDLSRGFLPPIDPLWQLPEPFAAWEEAGNLLSKLVLTPRLRPVVDALPPFPADQLQDERELERAMTLLSYLANLYLWAPDQPVVNALPRELARGWYDVSQRLDRPPALTYASQSLYNWRRLDPEGPVAVDNIIMKQTFVGSMDEVWFVTLHINIEAAAAPALQLLWPTLAAVADHDDEQIIANLAVIAGALNQMQTLLERMPERCEPFIYYHRVRPFMFGWRDNPLLPDGLIYSGVEAWGDRPVQFRGETGAESSIVPALDAFLGISHEFDEMRAYLLEMRDYMPAPHRQLILDLESASTLRAYVSDRHNSLLREAYNGTIQALGAFRRLHIEFAARYIIAPAKGAAAGEVGTGGTPFTVYLKKHIRETERHLL
ncbi:MAG: hypothetical protein KDE34_17095 [Anaerolineales bacterium]|nr:hypothetical protein [Anaerolineales bacterium]